MKSKDAAAIEEFVDRLRVILGNNFVEVKLFGSKAAGKDKPESDKDVLLRWGNVLILHLSRGTLLRFENSQNVKMTGMESSLR